MTDNAQSRNPIPTKIVSSTNWDIVIAELTEAQKAWAAVNGFTGKAGQAIVLPDAQGQVALALLGSGSETDASRQRFIVAGAASKLPKGDYTLTGLSDDTLFEAALGWSLEAYRFTRYAEAAAMPANLVLPETFDANRLNAFVAGETLTRDLINTPSSDMGPEEIEQVARSLAETHGAEVSTIKGDTLLDQNFPMIHAVGRASPRAPRLIDVRWGTSGPKLTLVGKGVCFDTGGLNLKPGGSMGLMKKDMGGAATVLGLAHIIMALDLGIQLRVLIPAVENSVSGNAFRPQDILTSRKGLSVEVNNTDAEGRLVLADALAYASEDAPDLIVSMATLTGAARVAVGPDLAPFYTDEDATALALSRSAVRMHDPVWRMPFHAPYERLIEPGIADLDNAPSGGMAGSITAALFLRRFVETPYIHFDIYGWQPFAAPGRPKGGVGQGARALFDALPEVLGL